MVEKIRFGGEWNFKKWVAAFLFGAIIVVFALWGIKNDMGDGAGGVAAVVNDRSITLSEFRSQIEQVEQNARARFDGLPEQQRRAMTQRLRQQVLDQLIMSEILYQAANKRGVIATDHEVKEQILAIPFLQEGGRFQGDRYRAFLANMNLTAEDFERQIRKQIVTNKIQELFVGSAAPTREEIKRNRQLANQKVNLRFSEITRDDLNKLGFISEADVITYGKEHANEIEAYYRDNRIEFTQPEKYRARDILIRIDGKRDKAAAQKLAGEIKAKLTKDNFAKMAAQHSEDPGSKSKGGDLGERERGSMMPEFEMAALALEPGQISQPVELEGGFHLILLESKKPSSTQDLESVKGQIARKLLARTKEADIVAKVRAAVESGNRKEIDGLLAKAGVKAMETGEFDLAAPAIPKLGEAKEIMPAVMANGKTTGLVKRLIPFNGSYLVVEVLNWKETPDNTPEIEGMDRMMAFRKAEGAIEAWAKEIQSKADVQKNPRLLQ